MRCKRLAEARLKKTHIGGDNGRMHHTPPSPSKRRTSTTSARSTRPERPARLRRLQLIVTWLGLCLLPTAHTQNRPTATPAPVVKATATAEPLAASSRAADDVIREMARAFRNRDQAALTEWLPQARGHALEPWAAYWELAARLPTASEAEVDAFLRRYAGSYQEDRLRNDWLLQLGQTGDWQAFARFYPAFRMRDDHSVRCYAIMAAQPLGISREESILMLNEAWFSRNGGGSACHQAAAQLYAQGLLKEADIWRKARHAAERRQPDAARQAIAIVDATAATQIPAVFANPQSYLETANLGSATGRELAVLAATRQAAQDPGAAAQWLQGPAATALASPQRNWLWGSIGRQAALNLDLQAAAYFAHADDLRQLDDEHLGWMARSAMRTGNWPQVRRAIEAMSPLAQREPVWKY